MSEQGAPPRRPQPPQGNAYDPRWQQHQPQYQPPHAGVREPPRYEVDPNRLYISIAKAVGIAVPLVLGLLYANNMLKDFQRETQIYQQAMQEKMSSLVRAMQDMTTARDLSDFCMMAEKENPTWKCPSSFQWRRSSNYMPAERPRHNVTRIELGER